MAVVAAANVRAQEAEQADALLEAWWETAEMIGRVRPWEECAAHLEKALADAAPGTPVAQRCQALLESLRLNVAGGPIPVVSEEAYSIDELIVALAETRAPHSLVLEPLQAYSDEQRLVWDVAAERAPGVEGRAPFLLYRQGRPVIPRLIAALEDRRATRSVMADRTRYREPLVVRVGDVALALIESLSVCRLHLEPTAYTPRTKVSPLFTEWSRERQAEQINLVRAWWTGTQDLPVMEAAYRRIEQVDRETQLEMLDAWIAIGAGSEALRFLQPRVRSGEALDFAMARRMLRAGSRAPLAYLHDAVRGGKAISAEVVRLIGDFGGIDDYKLLRDAILGRCGDADIDANMIVNQFGYSDDPLVLPVLVAVIETRAEQDPDVLRPLAAGSQVPAYLLRAAERIEMLTGADFGITQQSARFGDPRGLGVVLEWWRREGKAAYDYEQIRPHAPRGIR